MTELRAPDPTLVGHPMMVYVDLYRPLPITHLDSDGYRTPCGIGLDPDYVSVDVDLVFMSAEKAAYISVPCRACFPDAPEPGTRECLRDGCPTDHGKYLSWQVAGGSE